MASPITARRSPEALHFTVDQLDFLEIQQAGACIARSIAPDGSLQEYIQNQPKMLETIMELPGEKFGVGIEQLPTLIAEHFAIPSVIVMNLGLHMGARVLIAREPLGLKQLNLLRDHLRPFVGIVNKDQFFVPKRALG
jgi:hypothetical protein